MTDLDGSNDTDDEEYGRAYMCCLDLNQDVEGVITVRAHLEYTVNGTIYTISDSSADSTILGQHAHVLSYTGRHAHAIRYPRH